MEIGVGFCSLSGVGNLSGTGKVGLTLRENSFVCNVSGRKNVLKFAAAKVSVQGAELSRNLNMKRLWKMPTKGWEEQPWERPDYGFGDWEQISKKKLPSIPRSKIKEWCRKHGCSFRTEVTMRPQRHYAKPWFCTTHVRSERRAWMTVASSTAKLKSVDESINLMYRRLLKEPEFTRWDDPLF
mmetsp:Transcript_3080/g.5429  ORF Transcript_3080/g.5429 Transcript_3080/m.5429 type:complete len:183 (-) Transcript_3080:82-630(-)